MKNTLRITPQEAAEARQALALSQAKVSHEIELNRSYLSQFEQGKRVLDNKALDNLRTYYESQGWIFNDKDDDDPTRTMRIVDGFVVSVELTEVDVEILVDEYYSNANRIRDLEQHDIKRGLFGGIAEEDVLEQVLPLLLLSYRQCQIKEELQKVIEIANGNIGETLNSVKTQKERAFKILCQLRIATNALRLLAT